MPRFPAVGIASHTGSVGLAWFVQSHPSSGYFSARHSDEGGLGALVTEAFPNSNAVEFGYIELPDLIDMQLT